MSLWLRWFPWRWMTGALARAHGFLDPAAVLAQLRKFAQPSEVLEPVELLRAGMIFHARGLMNSRAIQHNLDWIWPYWVERQFDPHDPSFIPRAFSITHINLTHRNWTAIGVDGERELPIVDPRGLVTPFLDGWSIDAWVVREDPRQSSGLDPRRGSGHALYPSREAEAKQRLILDEPIAVETSTERDGMSLVSRAAVHNADEGLVCRIELSARAEGRAWLAVALRPYNPEGVRFVQTIRLDSDSRGWTIDGKDRVRFSRPADRHAASRYRDGDCAMRLFGDHDAREISCDVGMATAAALFRIEGECGVRVDAVLEEGRKRGGGEGARGRNGEGAIKQEGETCRARLPDERFQFLHDAALRTLILHTPGDVYPGPFTYRRFWFRDAAFILHALLAAGHLKRVKIILDKYPERQTPFGYFRSQDGEWDSNGEALWIMRRYGEFSGETPDARWLAAAKKAARWIEHKRLPDDGSPHAGLFPPGFSAEHFGPNDYYYWDDFWGVAGLRAAAAMIRAGDSVASGDEDHAGALDESADRFFHSIEASLAESSRRIHSAAMPTSPYRRLDAAAVGSLAAGYPLQLMAPDDRRLIDTAEYLMRDCFVNGGLFQDMVHSGINAYLTLHIAQVLLRAGDARAFELMSAVAKLASPTGQWPEAIHPATGGGCMGDGQHAWAAAEWVLMVRSMFVREEAGRLILCSGIPAAWLAKGEQMAYGPAPTPWGAVTVGLARETGGWRVTWHGEWRPSPGLGSGSSTEVMSSPVIEVNLGGRGARSAAAGQNSMLIEAP